MCQRINPSLIVISNFINFYSDYQKYQYEMIWIIVFFVALNVFFIGKGKNADIANAWKRACIEGIG